MSLGSSDNLKLALTTQEGRTAKRAHQVFLLLADPKTGLDVSYPFNTKDNGKSRLELVSKLVAPAAPIALSRLTYTQTQNDLPVQFLSFSEPIDARLLIGSFGASRSYNEVAFQLSIDRSPEIPVPTAEVLRYGKLPEIHHTFKSGPTSPPIVVTLAFVGMVLATLPLLAGVVCCLKLSSPAFSMVADVHQWFFVGANLNHLSTAFKSAPVPHAVFLGSLVSIEGIFFLYYTSWNLFQLLPAVAAAGTVAFISGSRALGEVQGRRLAGLR